MGAAAVLGLAAAGADVVLTYRNKRARAESIVQQAEALGRRAVALGCDVTVAADRERALVAVDELGGGLDRGPRAGAGGGR